MGLREQILQAQDVVRESLVVPEWGVTLILQGLTAAERDDFEVSCLTEKRVGGKMVTTHMLKNVRAKLVAMCVVDEQGGRIFKPEDVAELGKKSGLVLARIFDVCQRLSGLTDDDIEELVKNSESDQQGSTASG